ncbi:MAG: hypothetical protein M3P26_05530 [Gemmatimonadota bacterium]|nr:hypothetical protein [Gemmatimonadota bacterium]
MRIRSRLPILAGVAFASASGVGGRAALAQTITPVTISGIVIADDRSPLPDALLGLERGLLRKAKKNASLTTHFCSKPDPPNA